MKHIEQTIKRLGGKTHIQQALRKKLHNRVQLMAKLTGFHESIIQEIDDALIDALVLYTFYGIEPGSMMKALLQNDLQGTLIRLHPSLMCPQGIMTLKTILIVALEQSHGSAEKYQAWTRNGGLLGMFDSK